MLEHGYRLSSTAREVNRDPSLARPKQAGAGIPGHIFPSQRPRIGMGDDRLAVRARRIKIGIQHAALIGELQFADGRIANVEPGLTEHALQPARISANQAIGQGSRGRREACCWATAIWHDTGATGTEQ